MVDNIKQEIEDKVIDYINSSVTGRLVIFKPEKNNFGADLAAERRGKYKGEKQIYFQINSLVIPAKSDYFIKDFSQADFKADINFCLIFAYFDDIKQKINDHIWLIPSLEFRDIAEVIKLEDGKKILRFQASSDIKNKNEYSRFIIDIKELGKVILDALEKGGKFDFKVSGLTEKKINMENLKDFLCEARRNTFAADATPIDNPRLLASKQLEFQKGDYSYRDVFFDGAKKFIGLEIVYQDLKPIWGMNYIGINLGKIETDFLKESLSKLAEKCRMGEICEYEKRELKYQDKGKGGLEEFSGEEEIFSEGKNIYKLNYQGGLL